MGDEASAPAGNGAPQGVGGMSASNESPPGSATVDGGSAGQQAPRNPSDGAVGSAGSDASPPDSSRPDAPAAGDASNDADTDAGGDAGVDDRTAYVYVSGYGANIHVFTMDKTTGALAEQSTANGGNSPSYLAFAPDKRTLYAINEASGSNSQVIAFAIDPDSGALSEINRGPTGGDGSPHLAVHPSGNWIAVAHYGSGHTTVLAVRDDGGVGAVVDSERGPSDDCGRAHQAVFDQSGAHLLVPCLQSNYVIQYTFDNGTLGYNDPATVAVTGGPRHMAFDPGQSHAYVLSELDSTITSFTYDASSGRLADPQTIDSQQTSKGASAHLVVHPAGGLLYASNRSENSLAVFSLDASGRPQAVDFVTDMIATPRDFTVDPSGSWLLSANQDGAQDLLVFRIDPDDGTLSRAQVVPVGDRPTFVGVLLLP